MPPRSLQDHVQSLIGRTVAEQKIVGTSASDVEARAVLESIALNLLLKPRAVLYLAHLARNALLNVVRQELAAIDALSKTIDDTANTTFLPSSTLHLDRARTVLLQMEGLEKIDASGNDFQRFSTSVENFLEKTLSKSVRKKGTPELIRPDTEAAVDLSTDFTTLVDLHDDLNQRLYALSVGIENFTSSPLGTILGLSTAYRARTDIEDIISIIDSGESGTQARDIAIRLIGDRAALKTVGALPTVHNVLVSTSGGIPAGYDLQAVSDPATASASSSVGPFTFAASATAAITVNGNTISKTHFPQTGIHLDNRAFIVSDPGITFPVTVPASTFLFVHFRRATSAVGYTLQPDGSYLKQVRLAFTAGPRTLAQVVTDLNTGLGSDGTAAEYLDAGTGRLIIIGNSNITSLQVVAQVTEPSTSTLGDFDVYNLSANDLLGFQLFVAGTAGSTSLSIILDALELYFSSIVSVSITEEAKVFIETIAVSPGTSLSLALPSVMSMNGAHIAVSNVIKLYGTINGKAPTAVPGDTPTPVNPTPLMDVGDLFIGSSGSAIQGLTSTRIILEDAIPTFNGDASVESALVDEVLALDKAVQSFVVVWLDSAYSEGLLTLDRALAILGGKTTPATRAAAKLVLSDLKDNVMALFTALSIGSVPSNVGTEERDLVNGIINTLTERRYDRALSLLLRLQVQEFFEMSGETASFGGNLLKTMSDLATTDIKFPNIQLDEDSGLKGLVKEPEA